MATNSLSLNEQECRAKRSKQQEEVQRERTAEGQPSKSTGQHRCQEGGLEVADQQQVRSESIRVKLKESNITNRRVELFEQLNSHKNGHAAAAALPRIFRSRSPSTPVHSRPFVSTSHPSAPSRGDGPSSTDTTTGEDAGGIWISVGDGGGGGFDGGGFG